MISPASPSGTCTPSIPTAAHLDKNRAITYGLFNPIEGRLKSRAGLSWIGPAKALELLAATPNGARPTF